MFAVNKIVGVCLLCLLLPFAAAQAEEAMPQQRGLPVFSELAEEAGGAVVNISTVQRVEASERLRDFFSPFRDHPRFEEFFERFFEDMPEQRERHALGSGFIISEDGYIATNNHVVEQADQIRVTLRGSEETYDADIVGTDQETDLALLKIDAGRDLPTLSFGDSEAITSGEWVVAIGNPFGLDHTVTAGIVSAKGRVLGAGPYDNFIQTDASINPGNSGGPLLNLDGEVIGINSAIVAQAQGIGFAIPSNMAQDILAQLQEHQTVRRGWLGVSIQDVDPDLAEALGLEEPKGALVASVMEGDPADRAGIREGDVIVAVNEETVESARDLTREIGRIQPGEEVVLSLRRNGELMEVKVEVGSRAEELAREEPEEPRDEAVQGMQLRQVTEDEAEALGLREAQGLIVTDIERGSAAHRADLQPGDVVLQADGYAVENVQQMRQVVQQAGDVVLLLINRDGQNMFRPLRVQ